MKRIAYPWLAITALLLLFLPGCGDYRKLNDRAQVVGIGIDPVEGQQDELRFTFQIPNLEATSPSSEQPGGGKQGGETLPSKNFTVDATSLQTALAIVQTDYNKAFYLGNMETIVVNAHLSADQFLALTEQLMREESIDKMAMMVATTTSAEEVLSVPTPSPAATVLESMWDRSVPQMGFSSAERLWEFWRDSETVGLEAHIPLVTPVESTLRVGGTLIFSRYGPATIISPQMTVYYNMLGHRIRAFAATIPDGDKSFDVKDEVSRSRIWVTMRDGRPVLHARTRISADLSSDESHGTRPLTARERQRYEHVMETYFESQMIALLKQLQETKTDPIGFGKWYCIRHPEHLQLVEDNWNELFAESTFDIKVNAVINRKGNLL
ncbi:Ger(x)C family spore germination protein [Alicyclobacillus acidiphilus]|uniref:Ger(x)C family spore germination protein n=1 Tax=Alicyclobacillus acidiphilus TaxID=182455 RepID=UPI000834ABA2|nr:Ger(x)C family spore germination C-terminal domain-containing protein [Alicyclobacillus acidiphilus]